MKWIVIGLAMLGFLACASAWREANLGGDNPTGNQWERRQAAPFGWFIGLGLLALDVVLWLGYTMIKAIL